MLSEIHSAVSSSPITWVDTINGEIIVRWAPNSSHDNVEIWAYNYPSWKKELLAKAPSNDERYEIEITCDFISKYTMDAKSEFSLIGLFDDDRSYGLTFDVNRAIYENKWCGSIPTSTTEADLVKIDKALSEVTHKVDGEWLRFLWEEIDTAEWVTVSIFDYKQWKYQRLYDSRVSEWNFVKRLDCDFASKYYSNWKVSIKLTSPTGKDFEYTAEIKSDIIDKCLWTTTWSSSTTSNSNFLNSSNTLSNSTSDTTKKETIQIIEVQPEKEEWNTTLTNNKPILVTAPEKKKEEAGWKWYVWWDQSEIIDNGYTREMNNAYKFGLTYGLTSAQSIESANMNWEITRAAMAKMITKFAENVLGDTPDDSVNCSFTDITPDFDIKYSNWITKSCKLWIMWIGIQSFKPQNNVLRAEFWTILSRLVFWVSDWTPYYQPHLKILKTNWIMNNIDPFKVEKRGNVLLMLMRTAQKLGVQEWIYVNNTSKNKDSKDEVNTSTSTTSSSVSSTNATGTTNSSVSIKKPDRETILKIVELIDPTLVEEAGIILDSDWKNRNNSNSTGTDRSSSEVYHYIDTWNHIATLYWDYDPSSKDLEILAFDQKEASYISLAVVPMYQEYFQYNIPDWTEELLFAFIPRNPKWIEYRYDIGLRNHPWGWEKKFELTKKFMELKKELWVVSVILEKLVPGVVNRDEYSKANIIETLNTFVESNNVYLKEIWEYLLYLVK